MFDVGVINVGYSRTTWTNRALPGVAASDTHKGGGMRCASPSIGTHATNGPTTVPAGDLDPATGQIWERSLGPLDRPPTPPTARVVALFCVLRGVRCLAGSEPAANERYMTLDGLVARDSGVPSVGPILRFRCANTSLLSPSRSQQVFVCLIRPSACCRKSGEMSFFFRPVRSGI